MYYDQLVKPDPKMLLEYNGICEKPKNYMTPVTGVSENKGVIVKGSYSGGVYAEKPAVKINKLGPSKLISRTY